MKKLISFRSLFISSTIHLIGLTGLYLIWPNELFKNLVGFCFILTLISGIMFTWRSDNA